MHINSETIKLKEGISDLINNCGLPPVNILLVLDSVTAQVNHFLQISIQQESDMESQVGQNGDCINE